ncbi:hypothetical protein ONS95_006288 [Cadophora gregata]|uniref:uncharacterized protein n=1 Tax=Cadophora gregata TaxID=51156 RepID=UPI0026DD9612|nr:uncharacterized protein ONS95_006288 [Cadophora gregata]KAK0102686.1 hypothetical protein ONS95_006288 [Cadophora gregata]KAK0104341.1 hypothetical protein ONS96_005426 [Cadophora gregata f. sp. sojae]
MDQSPPKRVTRARAAAKTTDTGIKTTKIATAASKAKVTRTVSTTKRKTRADDVEIEEQQDPEPIIEPEPKTTRGRARKTVQPDPAPEPEPEMNEPPVRPTRGRPKKAAAPVETPAPEPTRATRGRAKKIEVPQEESIVVEDPPKRPARGRATTVSKVAAPKKTVKFEEPDKENIIPIEVNAKGKGKAAEPATGLRAKPVRKAAATTTTRATRGRAKTTVEEKEKSSPLSPKKATQVATAKETVSEDELATSEKTPMRPLMKSPIKAPGSIFGTAKKLDFSNSNSITVNRVATQDLKGSIMASPARRPPQSPFKETFKASAQKLTMGNSMFQSPFKPSLPAPKSNTENSPFKASLLQSPARRPQSPTKVGENGSPSRSANNASLFAGTPKASTFKISRFATPRTVTKSAVRTGDMGPPSMPAATGSPASKDDSDSTMMVAEPSLTFSGRLSSIMPRDADMAFEKSEPIAEEIDTLTIDDNGQDGDIMAVDEPDVMVEDIVDHNTTPPASPPRDSTGFSAAFALRETDNNPFDDSESEDELASGSPSYSPVPMSGFNISHDFASSPATPSPFKAIAKTPKTTSTQKCFESAHKSKIGFTPLARQLSDWMAASPQKSEETNSDEATSPIKLISQQDKDATPRPSPAKSTFFEDEMSIRDELAAEPELLAQEEDILDANFEPVELDEEDMALAMEADEMSMLEPEEVEVHVHEELFEEAPVTEEGVAQASEDEFLVAEPTVSEFINVEMIQEELETVQPTSADEHVLLEATVETLLECEPTTEAQIVDAEPQTVQEQENILEVIHAEISEPQAMQESDIDELADEADMPSAPEPAPSEASQEYGDENAIPIDPQLMAAPVPQSPEHSYATPRPKRILGERVCHTVSKVPLKAAAEDTPLRPSPKKRSASISRLPSQRPSSNLTRNNTVISYSPTKNTPRTQPKKQSQEVDMQGALTTPSKAEGWSTMGTPARTPRRDINTSLLKGAVVFVDVHTSEGSDASALFTELLTQMGARCVKTWNWNGNSEDTSKIGITHVVFKDGGKRTLERAKETNGVVSCVGVGWVLDCERENKWLDESLYSVDTGMVPRGGHRRRKSMEPRALAKMNGELVSSMTPNRNVSPTKEFLHFPDTPGTSKSRRRESVQWIRSPASSSSGDVDDQTLILSPVPATPAPETISAYGEEGLYGEDTPAGQTPYFLHNAQLVQKTAPAGRRYVDTEQTDSQGRNSMGAGFLSEKKDETVMMRLMAARRKSMQFAPKVGSPLARGSLF